MSVVMNLMDPGLWAPTSLQMSPTSRGSVGSSSSSGGGGGGEEVIWSDSDSSLPSSPQAAAAQHGPGAVPSGRTSPPTGGAGDGGLGGGQKPALMAMAVEGLPEGQREEAEEILDLDQIVTFGDEGAAP
jgi:hypothetical protein